MQSMLQRYRMIVDRIGLNIEFRDILPGHPRYMHIMTVSRMGIMVGYDYGHARYFSPNKCTSYVEGVIVAAKVMYTEGDNDVYKNMYQSTAFADANFNPHITNFINWAYRKGVIAENHIVRENGQLYLRPHRAITHAEMKDMLYSMYRLANADTNVLKPLLTEMDACVTREEMAYTIAHILRGNPQIIMGLNDHFIQALYTKLQPLSVKDRRYVLNKIAFQLNEMSPARLYTL